MNNKTPETDMREKEFSQSKARTLLFHEEKMLKLSSHLNLGGVTVCMLTWYASDAGFSFWFKLLFFFL